MRNAVGIFVMLFAFVAVQAQTKVAHINSSQLIEAMPEADSIQKKLMKEQEQWQQILADKQSETRTKYESYLKQTEDPNASKAMLEIKGQEIENLQKQLQTNENNQTDMGNGRGYNNLNNILQTQDIQSNYIQEPILHQEDLISQPNFLNKRQQETNEPDIVRILSNNTVDKLRQVPHKKTKLKQVFVNGRVVYRKQ